MTAWISLPEMVARIEATRMDEAPRRCPACSCTAKHKPETRRCTRCGQTQPLEAFARNRSQPLGRRFECKDCAAGRMRVWRRDQKRRQFRAILGRAS